MQSESESGLQKGRPLSVKQANTHRLPHTSKPKHKSAGKQCDGRKEKMEKRTREERRQWNAKVLPAVPQPTAVPPLPATAATASFFAAASSPEREASRLALARPVQTGDERDCNRIFCSGDPHQTCGYVCVHVWRSAAVSLTLRLFL